MQFNGPPRFGDVRGVYDMRRVLVSRGFGDEMRCHKSYIQTGGPPRSVDPLEDSEKRGGTQPPRIRGFSPINMHTQEQPNPSNRFSGSHQVTARWLIQHQDRGPGRELQADVHTLALPSTWCRESLRVARRGSFGETGKISGRCYCPSQAILKNHHAHYMLTLSHSHAHSRVPAAKPSQGDNHGKYPP